MRHLLNRLSAKTIDQHHPELSLLRLLPVFVASVSESNELRDVLVNLRREDSGWMKGRAGAGVGFCHNELYCPLRRFAKVRRMVSTSTLRQLAEGEMPYLAGKNDGLARNHQSVSDLQ